MEDKSHSLLFLLPIRSTPASLLQNVLGRLLFGWPSFWNEDDGVWRIQSSEKRGGPRLHLKLEPSDRDGCQPLQQPVRGKSHAVYIYNILPYGQPTEPLLGLFLLSNLATPLVFV